jgi:hypothetical protein
VKRFRFLREALLEYEDAISYYEHARTGLGETFAREVDRIITLTLRAHPYMVPAHPLPLRGAR